MNIRPRTSARCGFTLLEVLVALVLLGIISGIYMYTSHHSQKNTGKAIDWQAESTVIEKTIEGLRTGYTRAQVQTMHRTWIDSSSRLKIHVTVDGGLPPDSVCKGFAPEKLAKVTVTAKREAFDQELTITTYLWLN